MFRSTKRPDSIGSRLLTSFSSPKVSVPPYVGFAAADGALVAPPVVVPVPGVLPHAARTRASVVRIASTRDMHTPPGDLLRRSSRRIRPTGKTSSAFQPTKRRFSDSETGRLAPPRHGSSASTLGAVRDPIVHARCAHLVLFDALAALRAEGRQDASRTLGHDLAPLRRVDRRRPPHRDRPDGRYGRN